MKLVRKLHLYLSVFFTPLLVFFIGTGWYQTINTERNKSLGEQNTFISKLTAVHVDQIYPKKLTEEDLSKPEPPQYSTKLFKTLVVVMSICLLGTIILGLFLAFKTSRRLWPVIVSLLIGFALPAMFLWLGQPR